ncbi:hypothetical protein [Microtetraspora sp. NBRC 16547]|uniref:AMIN-like domain-containing (lipo)protein n=1 Tax=Microtetraspora sp. NBRC 16547 TaxID=3030993 RepID=UPI0024A278C9|nr:hypothetical protein [Microtetraspora sp. NBRC 16547]GLW96170.1 hypothetical protein Misp02_02570 [Microtetraspora sp. NBRC 16547]
MKKTSLALALTLVPVAATLACGSGGIGATAAPAGRVASLSVPDTGAHAPSGAAQGADPTAATAATAAARTSGPAGTAAAKPAASAPAPPTSTKPVTVTRNPAKPPKVTGVRFAKHAGFDRVVIDLNGPMTGYSVNWTDKLVYDGSGSAVGLTGGAYLQVRVTPAAAHDSAGKSTWKGPLQVAAKLPNVRHIVNNGDFEGMVSVGLVLGRKAGFRVLSQSGPSRIVIDVAH